MNSFSLMYHDVTDSQILNTGFCNSEAQKYKIDKQIFEEQIKIITENISNKSDNSNLYLTFDDGGVSFIEIIAPILEKYGLKGYFFIATSFINKKGFVSEEDIIELDKRGHFIGIHSHTHPPNISLLKKEQLSSEWENSFNVLKEILRKDVLYASIPNGFFSKQSFDILSKKGIRIIFTSEPKSSIKKKSGVKIIGRYAITKTTRNEELMNLMQSFSIVKFKKLFFWRTLSLVKRIMGKKYFLIRDLIKK